MMQFFKVIRPLILSSTLLLTIPVGPSHALVKHQPIHPLELIRLSFGDGGIAGLLSTSLYEVAFAECIGTTPFSNPFIFAISAFTGVTTGAATTLVSFLVNTVTLDTTETGDLQFDDIQEPVDGISLESLEHYRQVLGQLNSIWESAIAELVVLPRNVPERRVIVTKLATEIDKLEIDVNVLHKALPKVLTERVH